MEQSGCRLFVAVPLPEGVIPQIMALNDRFAGIRFSRNLHLTLSFIGYVPDMRPFAQALDRVREQPCMLRLASLGFFPRGIFKLALDADPGLFALKAKIDAALQGVGHEPENRSFSPHITLCRLKKAPDARLRALARETRLDCAWQANEFCLYQSILKPSGAEHLVLQSYALR